MPQNIPRVIVYVFSHYSNEHIHSPHTTTITAASHPLVLHTCSFAGFCSFLTNPNSGERIGLGMTVVLTIAAIYLVANDVLPKTETWTAISQLYFLSMVCSLTAMVVSITSVSLYCIHAPEGALTEKSLLTLFVTSVRLLHPPLPPYSRTAVRNVCLVYSRRLPDFVPYMFT